MNITRKDASISNTDDDFPGSFEVVLSTAARDRDGDTLAAEDWKQPLPDHITFDVDHGMSVAATVGSGVPSIEDGKLIVRGTYSSLPRAQEVRTLVKEGHIRTTSVAFMSEKNTKDGTRTVRELLNGAFVAIPSNREALVLAAKNLVASKAGARHSTTDMAHIQAILEHAIALGAGPTDDTGAAAGTTGGKSVDSDVAETPETPTEPDDEPSDTETTEDTEETAPAAAEKAAPAAETDDVDLLNRLTAIRVVTAATVG